MTTKAGQGKTATDKKLKVSSTELAKIFGVSKQRVSQYVKDGMPRDNTRVYDLPTCVQWKIERSEDRSKESSLNPHKLREIAARTNKIEMDIALKKGLLTRYEDSKALLEALCVAVVNEFQALPGRILVNNETKVLITDECRNAAKRLAEHARQQGESLRDSGKFIEDT